MRKLNLLVVFNADLDLVKCLGENNERKGI